MDYESFGQLGYALLIEIVEELGGKVELDADAVIKNIKLELNKVLKVDMETKKNSNLIVLEVIDEDSINE